MWPGILFCGLTDSYWSYWSCTEYCRGWVYIRGTDVWRMELFWMSVARKTPFSIIKTPLTFILNCSLLFLSLFVQCMLNINQKSGIFIDCLHGIYILGNLQDLWLVLFFILRLIFILPTSAFFLPISLQLGLNIFFIIKFWHTKQWPKSNICSDMQATDKVLI